MLRGVVPDNIDTMSAKAFEEFIKSKLDADDYRRWAASQERGNRAERNALKWYLRYRRATGDEAP